MLRDQILPKCYQNRYYIDVCEGGTDGGYGGESVRTYSVSAGNSISYSVGASGLGGYYGGPSATAGGSTSLSYNGVSISAGGGGAATETSTGSAGMGTGGDYNRTFNTSGAINFQGKPCCLGLNAGYIGYWSFGPSGPVESGVGSPGGIILYFT